MLSCARRASSWSTCSRRLSISSPVTPLRCWLPDSPATVLAVNALYLTLPSFSDRSGAVLGVSMLVACCFLGWHTVGGACGVARHSCPAACLLDLAVPWRQWICPGPRLCSRIAGCFIPSVLLGGPRRAAWLPCALGRLPRLAFRSIQASQLSLAVSCTSPVPPLWQLRLLSTDGELQHVDQHVHARPLAAACMYSMAKSQWLPASSCTHAQKSVGWTAINHSGTTMICDFFHMCTPKC
jgi:hypothetical protein